jgi:hypothetical protein
MYHIKSKTIVKALLLFIFLQISPFTFAQQIDSIKAVKNFSAAVNVTNNGISLLPNFSLGKPAAIFNMVLGKKRLSFEPELRFALTGKPWSFLFWWRYKVVKTNKFSFNVGAHPAFAFRDKTFIVEGESKDVLVAQSFWAGELSPNYALTKNISLGIYYLHAFGLENDVTQNTNFLALRGSLSNISLSNQFYLKIAPQFYYLKMDNKEGIYATSIVTLTHTNSPFYISSILSKSIQTEITGKDFVWNVSLHYAFSKKYVSL